MRMLNLLPTLFLIAALTATEVLLVAQTGFNFFPKSRAEKFASLETELREKDSLINRLILEREAHESSIRKSKNAGAHAGNHVEMSAADKNNLTPEQELAQATQRVTSVKPAEFDAEHAVAVANILAGSNVARLIRNESKTLIEYPVGPWKDTDPVWEIFNSMLDAKKLARVYVPRTAVQTKEELLDFGLAPERVVAGTDGNTQKQILIEVSRTTENGSPEGGKEPL